MDNPSQGVVYHVGAFAKDGQRVDQWAERKFRREHGLLVVSVFGANVVTSSLPRYKRTIRTWESACINK